MNKELLIIGVSGVTCGGKTTTSMVLNQMLPQSKIISQDDYFLPVDDCRHVWIPELNHINFDIISSLDMDKLYSHVMQIVKDKELNLSTDNKHNSIDPSSFQSTKELQKYVYNRAKQSNLEILIIEGFCIFNYTPLLPLFHLKYYFTLDEEECKKRRLTRVYEPPDCPGYFEKCVWPEHLKQLEDVKMNVRCVTYFSNTDSKDPLEVIMLDLLKYL